MNPISAQISIYPSRERHLGPTIVKALEVFRARGLDVKTGTMSTAIEFSSIRGRLTHVNTAGLSRAYRSLGRYGR